MQETAGGKIERAWRKRNHLKTKGRKENRPEVASNKRAPSGKNLKRGLPCSSSEKENERVVKIVENRRAG